MSGQTLRDLLVRTEHSVRLTAEEYVCWACQISSMADFLTRSATQNLGMLVSEILADCVDLASPDYEQERQQALRALNESIPGAREHHLAPAPVRLVGHVFEMAMSFRGRHKTIWAMARTPVERLTGVDINTIQFHPLPHGLIVCRRYAGNHQLRNLAAIGNCLIRDDARNEIAFDANLSVVATHITVEQALMSLLESWRLGYGRARKYLCDVARGFENHRDSTIPTK